MKDLTHDQMVDVLKTMVPVKKGHHLSDDEIVGTWKVLEHLRGTNKIDGSQRFHTVIYHHKESTYECVFDHSSDVPFAITIK